MSKGKGKKKVVVKSTPRTRVFNYTSVCCNEPAKKPPVQRSGEDLAANEYSQCGLGKWECTKCGKNAKVKRSRIKETASDGEQTQGTNS